MEADLLYDILSGRAQRVKPQTPPPVDVDKIFKISSQYPLGSLIGMPKYPQQHPRKNKKVFLLTLRNAKSKYSFSSRNFSFGMSIFTNSHLLSN